MKTLILILALPILAVLTGCATSNESGYTVGWGVVQSTPNTIATQIRWNSDGVELYMPKEHDLEGFAYDPSTGKMTIDRFLSQSEQSTLAQGRREADLAAEYTGLAGQIIRGSTSVEGLSTDVDARLERLESMMEAISATSE